MFWERFCSKLTKLVVDYNLYSEGTLPHKKRAQHAKQASIDPAPSGTRKSSFLQQFNGNGDRDHLGCVQQVVFSNVRGIQ